MQSAERRVANLKRKSALDLNRVSWDDLRLLIVAARHKSFRKAAVVLHTSSATVTRRIERLERQVGVRLFDRLPEGAMLTREGQNVLAAAQQMERASLGLRRYLDRDLSTRGVVRCSVTEGLGTFWMMPKLADFVRVNPYTIVDLRCTMEHADVLRFESDVAVQLTRPINPDLIVAKLGRIHVYPFAARSYLDAFGAPKTTADLVNHRIVDQVGPQLNDKTVPVLLGLDSLEGIVAMRTNASTAHFQAVELGIGIGGLPTYAAALGADVVPLDLGIYFSLDIWLAYHPQLNKIPRVAIFIEWLRAIFDSRRYPWFQDEFVHPREFADWPRGKEIGPSRAAVEPTVDPRHFLGLGVLDAALRELTVGTAKRSA